MSAEYNSEIESNSSNDSVFASCGSSDNVTPEEHVVLQLLRQGIIETTEENIAYGKDISKFLQELGINPKTIPNDIREGLEKVSLILRSEHLSDTDDMTLRICREQKLIKEKKKHREERKFMLKQDAVYRQCSLLQKKVEQLQQAVNSLEDSIASAKMNEDKIYTDKLLLSKKLGDYQQTLEKLESEVNKMEIADVYPETIEQKFQQYLEASGELAELNQYINKYGELPPNLLRAKALLEVKEKEYDNIAKVFLERTK